METNRKTTIILVTLVIAIAIGLYLMFYRKTGSPQKITASENTEGESGSVGGGNVEGLYIYRPYWGRRHRYWGPRYLYNWQPYGTYLW
jgi:hypothetical protein